MYVYDCMCVCVCTCGRLLDALDPLELELQAFVNHQVWVLWIELDGSSARAGSACLPSLPRQWGLPTPISLRPCRTEKKGGSRFWFQGSVVKLSLIRFMGGKWALQLFFKMNQQGVFVSFIPKVIAQIHYPQFKQDNANCTVTKSTNQQTSWLQRAVRHWMFL